MPLIVFDLDGTLVDSLPDIAAAVNRLLNSRGLAALPESAIRPMVGDGLEPLIERIFAAHGTTPDARAAPDYLADYEQNAAVATRLYPGMADALDALDALGWRLAVCTNKPQSAADALMAALGLAGRFAAIGGGDSFPARKPDPMHLILTIAAADGAGAPAIMVGDHANDIAAATGASLPAIFAGWGYGRPGMERGAAAIAPSPGDVPAIAGRLLSRHA